MTAQRKREVTNILQVRIPKDALDSLDVNVGDVLQYEYDGQRIIITKYGAEAEN